jgi:hypothetical protein
MSFVSLIPAVSLILSKIPSILIVPSTMSLVVPAISVTIALSCSSKALSKLLLPTFGLPTITVLIPFLIISPFLLSFKILLKVVLRVFTQISIKN